MINLSFWKDKRVFITGHTGFKGSWLSLWLHSLGAIVTGFALDPPTEPSLYELCQIDELITSVIADVRDRDRLQETLAEVGPNIVMHMAAQPLVRLSYENPVDTFSINVMGTVHLLEAVRQCDSVRAVLNVTTDKCYENNEWCWGYRENDRLGGHDPYSSSKACSELVTSSYRNSFFSTSDSVALATARAGNVIGGGDWAAGRLIPDCIKSLLNNEPIVVRNPQAIRPWQHVLEPLNGYITLAQRLYEKGPEFAEAWNFGPDESDARTVGWIVDRMCQKWGGSARFITSQEEQPHEANYLRLDCSTARQRLDWQPAWNLETALDKVIDWTRAYQQGMNLRKACLAQIEEYTNLTNRENS